MTDRQMDINLYAFPPHKTPEQLNPLVLAYIGDAVYEVFVRQYLISLPNHRPHQLHKQATAFVSAKAQSAALERWLPVLTEEETYVVKRGRNAKSGSTPKNTDIVDYRRSTGFECLIGYLYYKRQFDRLHSLMQLALQHLAERTK